MGGNRSTSRSTGTSSTARKAKPAEGMRRVQISYSPDKDRVGEVVDVTVDEARGLVEGGRARYVADDTPIGKPAEGTPVEVVDTAGGTPSGSADTSSGGEAGSATADAS